MEVSVPGIVYLSTIPTFMRVNKVREIFSEFGEVNRIFLAPNPNVKKGFKEGWVEFREKKNAKRAVAALDMTAVSNRRRSRWVDQFWTLKYLSKFSWEQLHESVVKPSRRRQEGILEAKKEANAYKDLVAAANTANSGKRSKKRRPSFARTFDAQASPQHSPETSDDVLNFTTIG